MMRVTNVTENIIQSMMKTKRSLSRLTTAEKHLSVMTGMMEGAGRKGRPCREWIEYIEDCCQTDVYSATQIAQDRGAWKFMMANAMDICRLSAHG